MTNQLRVYPSFQLNDSRIEFYSNNNTQHHNHDHVCQCDPFADPVDQVVVDNPSRPSKMLMPFLGVKARLILALIAHPIIAMLIVLIRLISLSTDASDIVGQAKYNLVQACNSFDSALATAPAIAAATANHMVVLGVDATLDGLAATLDLAITIMEGIVVFIVNTYKSTFFCLLSLAIHGSLDAVMKAVQVIDNGLQTTMQAIKGNIQKDVTVANNAVSTFFSGLNNVGSLFGGGNLTPPTISMPSLNELNNVSLPSGFFNDLEKLNGSIPSLDQVRDELTKLIETPFEDLKGLISTAVGELKQSLAFQTGPTLSKAITNDNFCNSQMSTSFIDEVAAGLVKSLYIVIGLLVFAMLSMMAASAAWAWWEWRCLQNHVDRTEKVWTKEGHLAAMTKPSEEFEQGHRDRIFEMVTVSNHPRIQLWGIRLAQHWFPNDIQSQNRLRWFLAVLCHPAVMLCFFLGVIGLVAIGIQILAIRSVQASASANMDHQIQQLNQTLNKHAVSSISGSIGTFSDDTNSQLGYYEESLNQKLFGWVNISTTAVNNTLNLFVDDLVKAVNVTFGGTVLYTAAMDVMNCLVLVKIKGIQAGLDFISSEAQVKLPRVNSTDMTKAVVNGAGSNIISGAGSKLVGNDQDGNGTVRSIGDKLFNSYESKLKKEIGLFMAFLGIWLLVVIGGLAVVWWDVSYRDHNRKGGELEASKLWMQSKGSASIWKVDQPSSTQSKARKGRNGLGQLLDKVRERIG